MNKSVSLVTLILVLLTGSCSDEVRLSIVANDFFHVEIDDAWIPLLVRGNTSSGTILLFVQGGPGYPSIDFALVDYPRWKSTLEKEYAVAYYDQRGFGNKQGASELSTISIEQYQKDLLQISRFLKTTYPESKVVLLAHSWGASLGYHFMINHEEKNVVDGFISVCGPFTHDGDNVKDLRWQFRRNYLINVSDVLLGKGSDPAYWQEARQWAVDNNPISSSEQMKRWNQYVARAERFTETGIQLGDYLHIGFASPYNVFSSLQYSYNDEVTHTLIGSEQRYNLANDLHRIDYPVLMIGARYDDQAPLEELEFVFGRIGSSDKTFRRFDEAGHNVFLDDRDGFAQTVSEFVKRL